MKISTDNRILAFIAGYTRQNGISPTIREIADGIGFASIGSVHRHIAKLEDEGLLDATKGKKRALVLNTSISVKPDDEDEHHIRLIMANGENKYLSFAMHEGAPVFSGPFCMNDIHEAGDVIACCAMTEEAYDSAIEKYLGL